MPDKYLDHVRATLDQIRADGFYKSERVIESPQSAHIGIAGGPKASTEGPSTCPLSTVGRPPNASRAMR